jgi:hypothetical protein
MDDRILTDIKLTILEFVASIKRAPEGVISST